MAQQQPVVSLEESPDPDRCRHHWVIQPAMGPVSPGVCQACGEERDFMNYVESASWGDSRLGNRSNGGASEVAETVAGRRDRGGEEQ
ncbi:MAG: hypothetical protein BZY88_00305 [SAR202 cluster bacterium Io17-Chloro-G9]|nr:MAG: hypothetical protein BZY88_00305 [SAR202 cluster bacterium Io17-Chloro-G9]